MIEIAVTRWPSKVTRIRPDNMKPWGTNDFGTRYVAVARPDRTTIEPSLRTLTGARTIRYPVSDFVRRTTEPSTVVV